MHRILLAVTAVALSALAFVLWPREEASVSAPRPTAQAPVTESTPVEAPRTSATERTLAPASDLGAATEPPGTPQPCTVEVSLVTSEDEGLLARRDLDLVVAELGAAWDDTRTLEGTSDSLGVCRWSFEGLLELRSVRVSASDASPGAAKWLGGAVATPGEVQRLELQVSAGAALAGRVVDEHGQPLPGVEVLAWNGRDYRPTRTPDRVVTSDGAGRFALEHVGPAFTVVPRGEGLTAAVGLRGDLAPGMRAEGDLEVVLVPARSVSGRVLGPRGEAVEATLQVRAHWQSSSRDATSVAGVSTFRCAHADASTDAEGRFELGPLPPEPSGVRLQSELFGYRDLRLPDEPGPWTIRLDDRVVLRGSVLDASGAPVAGARVGVAGDGVGNRRVLTSANGSFEVRGLPDLEAGYVHVAADGFAPWIQEGIEATLDEPPAPIVARLEPGLPLSGRVVDDSGAPVVGARVVLEGDRPFERHYTTDSPATIEHLVERGERSTGRDGSFAFPDLYPGRFAVRAYPPGQRQLYAEVQASPGSTDVEIVLAAETYERVVLTGRVVDALDGTPVSSFVVTPMIESSDGTGAIGYHHDVRDAEGRFRIALSSSARLQLTVAAQGYFTWSEPMGQRAEGEHDYEVRLARERSLELRLSWPDGKGVDAQLSFRDEQDEPIQVKAGGASRWSSVSTEDGVVRGIGLPSSVVRMSVQPRGKPSQRVPPQDFTLDLRRDPGPVLEFVLDPLPAAPARPGPVDAFALLLSAERGAQVDLDGLEELVHFGDLEDLPESVQLLRVDVDLDVLAADGRRLVSAQVRPNAGGRVLTWRQLDTGEEIEVEIPAEVGSAFGGSFPGEARRLSIRAAGHDPLELEFDPRRENGGMPPVLVLRR